MSLRFEEYCEKWRRLQENGSVQSHRHSQHSCGCKVLHRLVGYPDQDHDPNIDGTRPGGLGFLEDARPSITWPDERINQ